MARSSLAQFLLRWVAPALVFVAAFFIYANEAFFSPYSALHIDLSINLTAAHALRDGADPYGNSALVERAVALKSPTILVYQSLFTSYIQPPTSALAVVPFSFLPWRQATRAYLVMNNIFLLTAAGLMLLMVRPRLPWQWAVAATMTIVAGFAQVAGSFSLGQVDATICLLLAIAVLGIKLRKPPVTGIAIAAAAAIKLIPGVLALYFLWKRQYAYAAWTIGAGIVIFLVSVPLAGVDTYRTYISHTLPGLLKGSTHYANISINAAVSRFFIDGPIDGQRPIESLHELPGMFNVKLVDAVLALVVLGLAAWATTRDRRGRDGSERDLGFIFEFYIVVTAGLLISSVTWEFYVIWLLPFFIAAFLAPARVLPGGATERAVLVGLIAVAYMAINYPGDFYLFDVNSFFYHPQWAPGVWVEDRVHLYHHGYNAVPKLRLAALSFLFLSLCGGLLVSLNWATQRQETNAD
jgi:hypothetical protein